MKNAFYNCRQFLLLVIFPFLTLTSTLASAGQVTIAVSNDFDFTLDELKTEFERLTSHTVTIMPGPSSKHYGEILNGAPYDIFLADDVRRPAALAENGQAIKDSLFTYAENQLVLWSVTNRPLSPEVLREKSFGLLAVTDPRLSNYGQIARQALDAMGVWDTLQDKIVFGNNIGQTYQFAISGDVDLALIDYSQIIYGKYLQAGSYWLIPEDMYTPIAKQGVLLKENPAARDFLDFMRSNLGRQIILGNGFNVP